MESYISWHDIQMVKEEKAEQMILSANKEEVRKGKKDFWFLKFSCAIFLPQMKVKKIAVPFYDLKEPEHTDLD